MVERAAAFLDWLLSIPDWLIYVLVGFAAALENVVPPIPADIVVVIGGVLTGAGDTDTASLFLAVWGANVAGALVVYWLGFRFGPRFFQGRLGSFLLAPVQLRRLARAYQRYGFIIIFFSRFLPVFRPVVPAFAGVSRLGFFGTALPIALASAIWYGALVYLGNAAGANWRPLLESIDRVGTWLWVVTGILLAIAAYLWNRTRTDSSPAEDGDE